MRIKGLAFRSYVQWLAKHKHLDDIVTRVPPSTAALLRDPPLPGTWIDGMELVHLVTAFNGMAGLEGVRRLSLETLQDMIPKHSTLISGVLRLFGTSPGTLFKRANDLVKTSVNGIHYAYQPTGARSGRMEVRYDVDIELPVCVFVSGMTFFLALYWTVGVKGSVGEPERTGPASVAFQLSW